MPARAGRFHTTKTLQRHLALGGDYLTGQVSAATLLRKLGDVLGTRSHYAIMTALFRSSVHNVSKMTKRISGAHVGTVRFVSSALGRR